MRFAHPPRKEERLVEPAMSQSLAVKGHGHDEIYRRKEMNVSRHPPRQGFSERKARPVLELVNGFPERPLEMSDGQRLIILRGPLPARAAFVFRTCGERLRRLEGPAASRTGLPLDERKIGPAISAEKGDDVVFHRRAAVGAGGGKDEVEEAMEDRHNR